MLFRSERARAGEGPTFLECKTYRYYGHFLGDDPLRYRTREEESFYRGRDCIERFERAMRDNSMLSESELRTITQEVEQSITDAVAFAESSPVPDLADLTTEVYSETTA